MMLKLQLTSQMMQRHFASPIILNNFQSSEQPNKTTSLLIRPKDASKNYEYYIEYLKKFDFKQSDLTDAEFRVLLKVLLDDEDVYSHHKYDIGRTKQKFYIPLKKDCEFKKQCPSKIPLHLREKLESFMDEPIQAGIIRKLNEHDDLNSWFVNPILYCLRTIM